MIGASIYHTFKARPNARFIIKPLQRLNGATVGAAVSQPGRRKPTIDDSQIKSENHSLQIQIIDMQGNLIKLLSAESTDQITLDLRHFNSGTYLVKLRDNVRIISTKKLNVK